jgi:pimeloyl-ACP methyl ester carboxylesterase
VPANSRRSQSWILDRLVTAIGIDALMPSFSLSITSPVVGFNVADMDRIRNLTTGLAGMRREYERAGTARKEIAQRAEEEGHSATARRQYHLAALCFGVAQYLIQVDGSQEKQRLHAEMRACYEKVCAYADYQIEYVEIPFEDDPAYLAQSFPGVLHVPPADGPVPCVIFLPGTDTFKEQIPNPEDNLFAKRGLACLSLDGPGQGESLLRGLKVHVTSWNYERAVSAAIDYLETRPEIDSSRIAVYGISTGSYWAARAAIHEARGSDRIRACAGLKAQWQTGFVTEFEYAQPAFKTNYMYMAGIDDEAEFDRQAPLHTLDGLLAEITCPVLIGLGEHDELCTPDEVAELIDQAPTRHDLWIYEGEFHPMGGVVVEAWEFAVDWMRDRLLAVDNDVPGEKLWIADGVAVAR